MKLLELQCKCFIDCVVAILSLIIALVTCIYTKKTYDKSHSILDVINNEKAWKWNKKELEYLFSYLPIDCIDAFFNSPEIIRKELWWGLRSVDLNAFQYKGSEKELIIQFVKNLDSFCDMNYEQTPSGHWKYAPLSDSERYDAEKKKTAITDLGSKAIDLRGMYVKVKDLLVEYQIDIKDLNHIAHTKFDNSIKKE